MRGLRHTQIVLISAFGIIVAVLIGFGTVGFYSLLNNVNSMDSRLQFISAAIADYRVALAEVSTKLDMLDQIRRDVARLSPRAGGIDPGTIEPEAGPNQSNIAMPAFVSVDPVEPETDNEVKAIMQDLIKESDATTAVGVLTAGDDAFAAGPIQAARAASSTISGKYLLSTIQLNNQDEDKLKLEALRIIEAAPRDSIVYFLSKKAVPSDLLVDYETGSVVKIRQASG